MMHPATAPTLPCPARWPATPPTMAPLMHPFASAAGQEKARPRIAVQTMSGFIGILHKEKSRCDNRDGGNWFRKRQHCRRPDQVIRGRASASATTDDRWDAAAWGEILRWRGGLDASGKSPASVIWRKHFGTMALFPLKVVFAPV